MSKATSIDWTQYAPGWLAVGVAIVAAVLLAYRQFETIEKIVARFKKAKAKAESISLEYHKIETLIGFNPRTRKKETCECRATLINPNDFVIKLRVDKIDFKLQSASSTLPVDCNPEIVVGKRTTNVAVNSIPVAVDYSSKVPMQGYVDINLSYGRLKEDGTCLFNNKIVIAGMLDAKQLQGRFESRFHPYDWSEPPTEIEDFIVSESADGLHKRR